MTETDYPWIQTIRSQHDRLFHSLIEPHIILVFPVEKVSECTIREHVEHQVWRLDPINFRLRSALVVKDHFSEYTHVFLVPHEGFGDIVKLHDRLYAGPLAQELRLEIHFVPHMRVATLTEPFECKRLADRLNGEDFCIDGTICCVDSGFRWHPCGNRFKSPV